MSQWCDKPVSVQSEAGDSDISYRLLRSNNSFRRVQIIYGTAVIRDG